MNLGSIIRGSAAGEERRSIASGVRRLTRTKPAPAIHSEEQEWMTTYTDLVTLLLTLFVILISMASFEDPGPTPNSEAESAESQAPVTPPPLNAIFEFQLPELGLDGQPASPDDAPYDEQVVTKWTDRVEIMLRHYLSDSDLVDEIEIEKMEDRVIVHLRDRILFSSGESRLRETGRQVVRRIAPVLAYLNLPIIVEGHTDNLPITSPLFPSNWELSAGRAAAVVRRLIGEGIAPERLMVAGFAETRPQASNETRRGRARNRRVSVVLKSTEAEAASADIGRQP